MKAFIVCRHDRPPLIVEASSFDVFDRHLIFRSGSEIVAAFPPNTWASAYGSDANGVAYVGKPSGLNGTMEVRDPAADQLEA